MSTRDNKKLQTFTTVAHNTMRLFIWWQLMTPNQVRQLPSPAFFIPRTLMTWPKLVFYCVNCYDMMMFFHYNLEGLFLPRHHENAIIINFVTFCHRIWHGDMLIIMFLSHSHHDFSGFFYPFSQLQLRVMRFKLPLAHPERLVLY